MKKKSYYYDSIVSQNVIDNKIKQIRVYKIVQINLDSRLKY
jgi:hypothetical protein